MNLPEQELEAYRKWAENWTEEDEAFSQAAHRRSAEVVRMSTLKEDSNE